MKGSGRMIGSTTQTSARPQPAVPDLNLSGISRGAAVLHRKKSRRRESSCGGHTGVNIGVGETASKRGSAFLPQRISRLMPVPHLSQCERRAVAYLPLRVRKQIGQRRNSQEWAEHPQSFLRSPSANSRWRIVNGHPQTPSDRRNQVFEESSIPGAKFVQYKWKCVGSNRKQRRLCRLPSGRWN